MMWHQVACLIATKHFVNSFWYRIHFRFLRFEMLFWNLVKLIWMDSLGLLRMIFFLCFQMEYLHSFRNRLAGRKVHRVSLLDRFILIHSLLNRIIFSSFDFFKIFFIVKNFVQCYLLILLIFVFPHLMQDCWLNLLFFLRSAFKWESFLFLKIWDNHSG